MCRFILIFITFFVIGVNNAKAVRLSIIRDAEIEDTIKSYLIPLFKTAKLNADAINVIIVNNISVNAFVTGGSNVYVHTGLILKSKSANEVISVLAHETGHVVGGHVIRLKESIRIAQRYSLMSMLLGGIAGVASGRGDVGAAITMGSMGAITKGLLSYRVSEENSADGIAVDLLVQTNQSLKGLVDIMKLLEKESRLYPDDELGYYQTHPLSKDRISFSLNQYEKHKDLKVNDDYEKKFSRIKAKLLGFLGDKEKIHNLIKGRNDTDSLYALAIYHFKNGEIKDSIKTIDELISKEPNNPYFYELKGQVYFETGNVSDSLLPYRKAVSLKPESSLLVSSLTLAEIEEGSEADLKEIGEKLSKIILKEKHDPFIWRLYATCYGRLKDDTKASYGMAEYNFLLGNYDIAMHHAKKANKNVLEGSPMWFNIQDIISSIEEKGTKNDK